MSKTMPSMPDLGGLNQLCEGGNILLVSESYDRKVETLARAANHITLHCPNAIAARFTKKFATDSGLNNIAVNINLAEELSYGENQFDVLIGQDVTHTFSDVRQWLQEAGRVLKSQGLIVLTSHLVPGTRLRGKKALKERQAGNYINAWWQLRDRQHKHFYSQHEWEDLLQESGFEIGHLHSSPMTFDFALWVDDASLSEKDRLRLKSMLIQAPEKVREFLTPQFSGDRINFCLPEINILASSKLNKDRRREYENSADDPRQID